MQVETDWRVGLDAEELSPIDYLPVKLYIMKKLFLAGAIGISIAALAASQTTQKGSSSWQGKNNSLSAYQDTVPKRDSNKWPKDTLPKRDSINLQ
jgi:hypothetical protein